MNQYECRKCGEYNLGCLTCLNQRQEMSLTKVERVLEALEERNNAKIQLLRETLEDIAKAFDNNMPERAFKIVQNFFEGGEICKDLSTSVSPVHTEPTPAATDATSVTSQSTSSGEHGSPETSQSAGFADPITRLALEAMREAESDPNVLTHNLLIALSTSAALRGVSNTEAYLRDKIERISKDRQELEAQIKTLEAQIKTLKTELQTVKDEFYQLLMRYSND